jgi:hypothetical protein
VVVNVPLIVAGSVGILAAAVHGVGGEVLVVRRLSTELLPPTSFGGPRMTRAMIHVTWHITTIAFLTVGCALLISGAVLDGDTAQGIGLVAAAGATGFAVVAVGLGSATQPLRSALNHPGPIALTAMAALAWWGVA